MSTDKTTQRAARPWSHRCFLKTAATAAGVVVVVPRIVPSFLVHDDVQMVAACDVNQRLRRAMREPWKLES